MSGLLFQGGAILTMDPAAPVAEALLVDGDRIAAVGSAAEVSALADGADVIDLDGGVVCPGFIDAHNHFMLSVVAELGIDCRVPAVSSLPHMFDVLERTARATAPGTWIRGWGYSELDLGRHPTVRELDAVAPDHPLVIGHVSAHMCVANTRALAAAGITAASADPPGGMIERDRRGRPTGVLNEQASEAVDLLARTAVLASDPPASLRAAHTVAGRFASLGLTTICDPCVPASVEPLYGDLVTDPDFPLHLTGLGMGAAGMFAAPHDRFDRDPSGSFQIGGVKIFADGGEQCAVCLTPRGAARLALRAIAGAARHRTLLGARLLTTPKARVGRDRKLRSGLSFHSDTALAAMLQLAAQRQLTGAVHALGNAAIDQALDAFEQVRRIEGDEPAFRMEHVMLAQERALPRIAELGVTAVVQPRFVHDIGFEMILTGSNREFRVLAFRDLMDHGALVVGSSDAPVAEPAVLPAIESMVTRATATGHVLDPDQALTVEEGLALYTANAARALGLQHSHGTLRAGSRADLVVLSADPRSVSTSAIGDITVERTYLAGRRTA